MPDVQSKYDGLAGSGAKLCVLVSMLLFVCAATARTQDFKSDRILIDSTGTKTINDVGFQPDVIIFRITSTHDSFDSIVDRSAGTTGGGTWGFGQGFVDCTGGSFTERALTVASGSSSPNGARMESTDAYSILQIFTPDDGDGINGRIEASVTSRSSDGFTIDVATQYTNQYVVYEAYQFESGVNVSVGHFTTPTSTGTDSVTGLGFEPNFLSVSLARQITSINQTVAQQNGDNGDNGWSHGFAGKRGGTIEQTTMGVSMATNNTDDHVWHSSTSDVIGLLEDSDKGGIDGKVIGSLSSFDGDGFTIDYSNVNNGELAIYLAIGTDSQVEVGSEMTPTSTGIQTINTNITFDSLSLLANNTVDGQNVEKYSGSNEGDNHHGWMGGSGYGAELSMGYSTHSNSTNGHSAASSNSEVFRLLYTDQDGNLLGQDRARIDSFSGSSFDLDWTSVVTTADDSNIAHDQVMFMYFGFDFAHDGYNWTGNGDGTSWNDQGNWDIGDGSPGDDGFPDDNGDVANIESGSASISTPSSALTVGEVWIAPGYSGTITLSDNLTVDDSGTENGKLTLRSGTLDANNQNLSINENVEMAGGVLATGEGTITFGDGGGDLVTISSGELHIESDDTSSDLVINAGTWENNGGTIRYTASTDTTLNLLSSISPYHNLEIDPADAGFTYTLDGAITAEDNLTISNGTLDTDSGNSYSINVGGNWTNNDTFTVNNSTVTFDATGGSPTITSGGSAFWDVTFNDGGNGVTWTLGDALDVDNNLTITSGTLDTDSSNNYSINVGGNWSNSGTFTANNATVTFDASGGSPTITTGGSAFWDVDFNDGGSGVTWTLGDALDVDNNLTITSGTLDTDSSNSYSINVGGNWSNSGTFTANNSTTTFDATGGSPTITSGGSAFWNVTIGNENIGEAGTTTLSTTIDDGEEDTINFANTYVDPVIVAFVMTRGGSQSYEVRVKDVTSTSCVIFSEEADDEGHNSEEVGYIVMEKGTWTLDDGTGTKVEANWVSTGSTHREGDSFGGSSVSFNQSFSSSPAVLHSLNTYNNGAFMTSVAHNVTSSGFDVQQEAGGSGSSSTTERIGWIAIESGTTETVNSLKFETGSFSDGSSDGVDDSEHLISYSQSFSSAPIVVVKGNSGNDTDGYWARGTGTRSSSDQGVYAEEDQFSDGERNHGDETFAFLAIESSGGTLKGFGGGPTWTLGDALDVNNNLTIKNGTVDTNSSNNYAVNVGGNWTNKDTFLANNSTVTFDATGGSPTITSGGSAFWDVTFNDGGNGVTWTMQDQMTAKNSLTISNGTLATDPHPLILGNTNATTDTIPLSLQADGQLKMVGGASGNAMLSTKPADGDRINITVDGTFHAQKATIQYLTGSGIQFMDESTLNKLEETTFDFGASGGVYLNFDADTDDGSNGYNVRTPVSSSSSTGPAWLDTVEFRDTGGVSPDNVDADNSDTADDVVFQNNDGSSDLSPNAVGFFPVLGDRAGASHEQDDPDGADDTGQVRWSNGVAVVKASGTVQSRHRKLQTAINQAGSGETVTQDGNRKFSENLTLPDGQNLTIRDVLVKGTIDGDGSNNTNTLFNVVVTGGNAIGASNDVGTVYNTMVVDGSITAETVKNSVTVDTDGTGSHGISASTSTNNETGLADGGGGLVAYWDFESGSGSTAIDRSGNGNDGTLNDPSWATDPSDTPSALGSSSSSLEFDRSSGDYVKIDGHVTESSTITVSVWAKIPDKSGAGDADYQVFSIGSYYQLAGVVYNSSTSPTRAGEGKGDYYNGSGWNVQYWSTNIDDGSWHHLAYVLDRSLDGGEEKSHMKVYVDGSKEGEKKLSSDISFNGDNSPDTYIGRPANNDFRHWDGYIDDLRVYNRALTSGEIGILANGKDLTRYMVDVRSDDVHITIPDGITAADHPLIDKGTDPSVSGLDEDFDGNARPMNGGDGGGWDIGPDEYHPYADPQPDLQFPASNQSWTKIGELEKNARRPAQCIYVPYITGGTGHVRAYSVDVDGGFGDEMGHFDGRKVSNGGDLPTDQNGNANKAHEFVDLYVSRFWQNGWTNPGFRIYAIIDTTGNGQGDKVYAFRHVDTSGDGRVNAMVQGWSDTRDVIAEAGKGHSLSDVDARRISVKLNDNHLYLVDGFDNTAYKLNTGDGSIAARDSSKAYDPAFFHLPQTWNDEMLMGLKNSADELVELDGSMSSTGNTADFGGASRLLDRLNFSAVTTGRMVYGTGAGEPHVWKIKSDTFAQQWGDGKSFNIGADPRSFPMVFPGVSFVWGVGKDRIFKVTRSDGSKPGDWGSSADWPLTFSGEALVSDYAYWPPKDLLFVGSRRGNGYMVNAVLDGDGSGGTSSSTGETDGTVTSGWPYVFPNRTLDGTKLVWDGNWNFSIIYVHENRETGDVSLLGFQLP